jgi:DNA-binding NarL/FixJ family response regulator
VPLPGAALFPAGEWAAIATAFSLSARELLVLQAVFDGDKESAIADDLGLSPHTVHTYFERLHRKLAARDRVELVLRVVERCFVR